MMRAVVLKSMLAFALVTLGYSFTHLAGAADVQTYKLSKGRDYQQGPERVPTNIAVNAFAFEATVLMTEPESVSGARVKPPGRTARTLGPNGDREFRFVNRASRKSVLDERFPTNGNYTFTIDTRNDGQRSLRLPLRDAYPPAPFVHHLVELQAVNPNGHLVVSWQRFVNGTAFDFIRLRIEDTNGSVAWESRGPGERGALDGSATWAIIEPGQLRPGTAYNATLFFEKFVTRDTNSYPGAVGLTSFYARTRFRITTTSDGPADVERYELSKGQRREQDTPGDTDPEPDEFIFLAEVHAREPGLVIAASLTTTLESTVALVPDALREEFEFSQTAEEPEIIEALFPPGNYVFDLQTATQGDRRVGLWFDEDNYPPEPTLSFDPAQEVSPDAPLVLSWAPWSSGTRDDFIQLQIEDEDGITVFETPDFDDRDALDGRATSVTIPAGTLRRAVDYEARLTFRRFNRLNWFDYPGALGISSIFTSTEFEIETTRPDLEEYSIARGRGFEQEGDGQPVVDPGDEFIFDAQVEASATNAIFSVNLRTPRGATIPMVPNGPDEFEFSDTAPNEAAFNALYPPGFYTFDIQARQGPLSVPLNVPDAPYPPAPHAHLGALGNPEPNVPVTLTWDPWAGGTTNDFIQVRIEDEDGETVFETPDRGDVGALNGLDTSVTIPPIPPVFELGRDYEGRITFRRFVVEDETTFPGAEGTVSYFSRTDFEIEAAGPDVEDYRIERGRRFEQTNAGLPVPDDGDEFEFNAEVQGSAPNLISSATLQTPPGATLVLEPNNVRDEFEFTDNNLATQAELDRIYPPGLYTFTVQSVNDLTTTVSLDVPASDFPPVPHVQFDPNVAVPGNQPFVLSWDPWVDGTEDDFIRLRIEDDDNDVVFETPNFGDPGALNGRSTSVAIPALDPNQTYEGQLTFARIVVSDETTLPGAEGRVTYFSRTDFDIDTRGGDVEDYRIERGRRFEQTTTGLPVPDPNDEFEFNAEVQGSAPAVILLASLRTPPGADIALAPNSDRDEFEFSDQVSTAAEFDTLYPPGRYTFAVQSVNQGLQDIFLDVPTSDFPPAPHVLFDPGTEVPANPPLVLGWDAWTGGTSNDFIQLRIEDADGDVVFETPDRGDDGALNGLATSTTIPVGTLVPGQSYEGRLVFERIVHTDETTVPGAEGRVTYFARTDFNFETVPGDVEDYRIERGRRFEQTTAGLPVPDLNDEFEFNAEVQGSATNLISSVILMTPRGTNIVLEPNNEFDEFEFSDQVSTQEEFDRLYPSGTYSFIVQGVNQGAQTNLFVVPASEFPPAPHVQFDPGTEVSPDQPLMLFWDAWAGGTGDDFIQLRIEDANNNVVFETPDRGDAGALNGFATSVTIPAGTLALVQTYEGRLVFERIVHTDETTIPGAEGTVIYFARTDFDIETGGGDVEDYRIERGRRFEQTTAGLPVPDPGDEFEFNAELQGSAPNLISSATLRTPPLAVVVLDPNNDFDEFEFSDQVSTQAEFDSLYPAGTYTFIVQSVNQGTQTIPLDVPASEFPPAPHVQFDPGTTVPADQPLLLQWDAWAGGTADDFIQLRVEDVDGDVVFETPDRGDDGALNGVATSTAIPAATLVPGQTYEGRLVFERIVFATNDAIGAEGRVTYFARTDFNIETVPGDVEDYRIERGRRFEQTSAGFPVPDPGDEFEVNAEVQGSAPNFISSATLTTPLGGTPIVLEPNNDFDEFEFSDQVSTQAEFDTLYPGGTYTFTVQGVNQGTQTIPLNVPASDFPPAPHVQFDPGTEVPPDLPLVLSWDFWIGGTADDFIQLRIEDANNNVVFETPDRGDAGALNGFATSVTIPAGTLASIQTYEGRLVFERIVLTDETTVPGAEGRVTYFSRTDFEIETTGGDVEDYRIERGRRFEQTTAGLPLPDPGDEFEFNAEVQGSAPNVISSVNLRTPPSAVIVLEPNNDFDEFEFSDQVSTQAELDALYPTGTYSFIVQSVNQGTQTILLDVPASEFPPAPHVQFDPGTEVAANLPLPLFWDAWVGGTADDFIQLRIEDADNNVIFETPDRGDADALNGLANATEVPAGTLVPGRVYEGRLVFERIVLTDETSVPGAEGRVTYFGRTDFDIETVPPDVQEYEVFKEHVYVQTSNGPPAATEFVFRALVEAESDLSVIGAAIATPFFLTVPLVQGGGGDEFELQDSRASQEAIDVDYPEGDYTLIINTVNDGSREIPVSLTNPMYPSAPQLSDFDAAQSINAAAGFVLAWNPFLDGTAQDHIDVQIEDSAGNEVFDTPGHGNDGALDGLATSVTIPPFTLQPGQAYEARILFQKILRADDSGYPAVVGRVGYSARTFAGIATAPVANPPPRIQNYQRLGDGSLHFNVSTSNGGTYQIQGSPNMIDWTPLGTISATSGLSTFTVPPPPSARCYFYRAALIR